MGIFDIFKTKMKRSYLVDDKITDDEWKYLNKGKCPDCGHPHLWIGPSGGSSTNYECIVCGSQFNLAIELGWGHRNNDNKKRIRQEKIDNILK